MQSCWFVKFVEDQTHLADEKLLRLEKELDVLMDHAHEIGAERTNISQLQPSLGLLRASSETTLNDSSRKFIRDYLELADQGKALDEQIKALAQECAASRTECRRCLYKIDILPSSENQLRNARRRRMMSPQWTPNTLAAEQPAQSNTKWRGLTDTLKSFEEIVSFREKFLNIGALVGTFGAGIAYTTLFSASRGRLDLISWAFTCFSVVVALSISLQILSPHYLNPIRIGFMEALLYAHFFVVGLPLIAGFTLLGLSVALLDADADLALLSSQLPVIRAAGGLQIATVGCSVLFLIFGASLFRRLDRVEVRQWFMKHLSFEERKDCPPVLSAEYILHFLPGGKGYSMYRQERLKKAHDAEVYPSRQGTTVTTEITVDDLPLGPLQWSLRTPWF